MDHPAREDRTPDQEALDEPVEGPERSQEEIAFHAVFEAAPLGMAVVGTDGRWRSVNRVFRRITGYGVKEFIGQRVEESLHPDDRAADEQVADRLLREEVDSFQLLQRYLHPARGIVWVRSSRTLVRSPGGEPLCFVLLIEEVALQRRLEEQRLNETAERARKSGMALTLRTLQHEINNPLQVLIGTVEILEASPRTLGDLDRARLRRLREASDRIACVLSRLTEVLETESIETISDPAGDRIRLPKKAEG